MSSFSARIFRLGQVAGDAVEDEDVGLRADAARGLDLGELLGPKADGQVVGNEFAPARILEKGFAERRLGIEGTEDVAAGAMPKPGNVT